LRQHGQGGLSWRGLSGGNAADAVISMMRLFLLKARILITIAAFARICLYRPLHIAWELKPALQRLGVLECFVCSRCPQ